MKECIIHAGAHKTGTTLIQARLAEIRDSLALAGLHIPDIGMPNRNLAAHHNIAYELNEDQRFQPSEGTLEQLMASLDNAPHERILLSSEALLFLARDPARMSRLRKPLVDRGYQITWIFYLRAFHEWLESTYTQFIKTGRSALLFQDWAEQRKDLPMYDPAGYLHPFFETGDRVIVRSYALARKNLFQDFMATAGLPDFDPGPSDIEQVNTRHNALQIEFLRMATRSLGRRPRKQIRKLMTKARRLCKRLPESPAFVAMSENQARDIYEETRESHAAILRLADVDTPLEMFFPPPEARKEQTFETLDLPPTSQQALDDALVAFQRKE